MIFRHFDMFSCFCVVVIVVVLCHFVRYPLKIMPAGQGNKLVDQKIYFGNGGVFTTVIQPNPTKSDQVRRVSVHGYFVHPLMKTEGMHGITQSSTRLW